jgi:hypothetical protein
VNQRNFYLVWDDNGLEVCQDLMPLQIEHEQQEKEQIWEILKDPDCMFRNSGAEKLSQLYHTTTLRARVNSQRNYEIFLVTLDQTVTEEDFRLMFDADTDRIKRLVRDRGIKVS